MVSGNRDVRSFFNKPKKATEKTDNPKKRPAVPAEKAPPSDDDDEEPVIKRRRKNNKPAATTEASISVKDVIGDTNESLEEGSSKSSPVRKKSNGGADADGDKNAQKSRSSPASKSSTPAGSEVIDLDDDAAVAGKNVISIEDDNDTDSKEKKPISSSSCASKKAKTTEVIDVDDTTNKKANEKTKKNAKATLARATKSKKGSASEVIAVKDAEGKKTNGDETTVSPARSSGNDSDDEEEEMIASPKKNTKKGKSVKEVLPGSKGGDKFELTSSVSLKAGKPVPYKFLAEAFEKVEKITGRLAIQAILTELFRTVIDTTPEDLVAVIYISINQLAPSHEGVELGIGESIVMKALSSVTGKSAANLKKTYAELGDLGDLAASTRATQKTMFPPPPLTVKKVLEEYRKIAKMSGKNSQSLKVSSIVKLLVATSSKAEAKYITRALIGKLRINLAVKTVITSLAAAMVLKDKKKISSGFLLAEDGTKAKKLSQKNTDIEAEIKEAAVILQNVYSALPVWDELVSNLMRLGCVSDELKKACKLTPGIPVSPMLAKPTKSISEVLDRFSGVEFTCEYKYDGERAQVHRLSDGGGVKIYSRNAEDLTPKYPDLSSALPVTLKEEFKGASFILDGESVAYDMEKKKILSFQVLQHRKRKDVSEQSIEVKVCYFAFDILFFNGESLIHKSLKERRKVMTDHFTEQEGVFMFAKGHDSKETEEILTLLNDSIKDGCEGLMVKALSGANGTYEPANRTQNWLKVKKDYLEGCGDTFDLVPIGGYIGKGKRTGTYGAFLLACYNPDSEEYQSICKIGTGFSEKVLDELAKFYNDPGENRCLERPKGYYQIPEMKNTLPDTWFEPCQVWEVKCADLSISPTHRAAAGLVDGEKGIALRFPRLFRIRDDKGTEDATSAEQVAELYRAQSSV